MKKITVLLFAAALCFCLFSCAERMAGAAFVEADEDEQESKHPIEIEIEKRIEDSGYSTIGTVEAYEYGAKEWDKLLNKNYQELMKRLSKEEQEALRASQREWIKHRDLEFAFNGKYWAKFEGTMYTPFPYAFQCNFVRDRALRLGYYLEDLNDM